MGRSKNKHDRRRAHQREQRNRKITALAEATVAARELAKDGTPLKRQRSGQALLDALESEMRKRGYIRETRWRTARINGKSVRHEVVVWTRVVDSTPEVTR